MKKYRCRIESRWDRDPEIKEVEVERETQSSVWINGRVERKMTEYYYYFDTWEDAYQALLNAQRQHVSKMEKRFKDSIIALRIIEEMKNEKV